MAAPEAERAIALLREVLANGLSGQALDDRWPESDDPLLRSVHFWLWQGYDDESAEPIVLDMQARALVERVVDFISSGLSFVPRPVSLPRRLFAALATGVEWRGAERPWHGRWPFPPGSA